MRICVTQTMSEMLLQSHEFCLHVQEELFNGSRIDLVALSENIRLWRLLSRGKGHQQDYAANERPTSSWAMMVSQYSGEIFFC